MRPTRTVEEFTSRSYASQQEDRWKGMKMRRTVLNIIAVVEGRDEGYADFPAGCLDEDYEGELAEVGYAVGLSDARWFGGYRIYGPESIAAGNYRPHVPPTLFTCADSRNARIPDARDFDFEAVLKERGIIPTN